MAAKKTASKGDKPMTKTGFIRSMSPEVPAEEVIAKAKEQGIELTKKLVWTTQSEMRGAVKSAGKMSKSVKIKKVETAVTAPEVPSSMAAAPASAKPAKKKPGPKAGFRKKGARAAAAPAKAASGTTAEQKLKALVIELGTTRADEVYRSVRAQLNAILG